MLKQQFLLCYPPLAYSVVQFSVLTVPRTPFSNHEPSQAPNAKRSSRQYFDPWGTRTSWSCKIHLLHLFMSRHIILSLFLDHILIHTQLSPTTRATTPPPYIYSNPPHAHSLSLSESHIYINGTSGRVHSGRMMDHVRVRAWGRRAARQENRSRGVPLEEEERERARERWGQNSRRGQRWGHDLGQGLSCISFRTDTTCGTVVMFFVLHTPV